jgi:hypothetical protein
LPIASLIGIYVLCKAGDAKWCLPRTIAMLCTITKLF